MERKELTVYVTKMAKNVIRLRLSLEIELFKVGETDFLGTPNQKKTHPKTTLKMVPWARLDQAGAAQPPQKPNSLKIQILKLLHPPRVARSSSYFAHLLHTRVHDCTIVWRMFQCDSLGPAHKTQCFSFRGAKYITQYRAGPLWPPQGASVIKKQVSGCNDENQ